MPWRVILQRFLPQHLISWLCGRLMRCRVVWIRDILLQVYVQLYQIDLSEALQPALSSYPDVNAFFTRALKAEARPIGQGVVSPVDGVVSQVGDIDGDAVLQAKGKTFSLAQLLGESADDYHGGRFVTLYLSPRDYHRVHMPIDGALRQMRYIPGRLFSVNAITAESIPNLYARNERLACFFDTELGPMSLVMVGALNVGSLETVWAGEVSGREIMTRTYSGDKVSLRRGDELGRFNMGSTVILVFGPQMPAWSSRLQVGGHVKFGESLSSLHGYVNA